MEIEYEAKCYLTYKACESCGKGHMESTHCTIKEWGQSLFEHICWNCKAKGAYIVEYPKKEFRPMMDTINIIKKKN